MSSASPPNTDTPAVEDLKVMSFGEHLEELRGRIIRSLLVTVAFALVALIFQSDLMEAISEPHRRAMRQVEGRRLADDVGARIAELRTTVAAIPLEEGARAVAVDAWLSERVRIVEERATTPFEKALADLVIGRLGEVGVEQGLLDRIETLRVDLRAAEEDPPWGGREPVEEALADLGTIDAQLRAWRTEAGRAAAPAETARSEESLATVRLLDRTLETLAERTDQLRDWRQGKVPLKLLSYVEAFFSHIKLAFLCGLLLGLPWITYEIWLFISAGLYRHERSVVAPFLPFSLISLLLGGTFAYKVLIPVGLSYLGGYGDPDVFEASFTLSSYLGIVFTLLIGMGLVFQLPIVMVFATRAGMVTPAKFREIRKFAIVGALFFGALLTPPDVVTQLLMAVPLVLLYETGILASVWFHRRRAREAPVAVEDDPPSV